MTKKSKFGSTAEQDVGEDIFRAMIDKYFEIGDVPKGKYHRYLATAIDLGINPYRICVASPSGSMLWGRYGGVYSWEFKYAPSFQDALKEFGEFQFNSDSRWTGWNTRPLSHEDCENVVAEASRNFTHLIDSDRQLLFVTPCEDMTPVAASDPFQVRWKPVSLFREKVMSALAARKHNGDYLPQTLRICTGDRFVIFPSEDEVLLRFKAAMFTIGCVATLPRTFICGVDDDGEVTISDFAYGSDSKQSSRLIAAYRELCDARAVWCRPDGQFDDGKPFYTSETIDAPIGRFVGRLLEKTWANAIKSWNTTWVLSNGNKVEIVIGCKNYDSREPLVAKPAFGDTNMTDAIEEEFYTLTVSRKPSLLSAGKPRLLDAVLIAPEDAPDAKKWGLSDTLEFEPMTFPNCAALVKSTGNSCKRLARLDSDLCNMHANKEASGSVIERINLA